MRLCSYVDAALGRTEADLLIEDARIVNVNTREIYESDIVIKKERIVFVGDSSELVEKCSKIVPAKGMYAVPGFLDAHIHVESSMLTPTQFSKVVVKHGTTSIIWDPHEVVNVSGVEGLKAVVNETRGLPLHVYFVIPSCVPSAPGRETSGASLSASQTYEALVLPRVIGLGEMMDYPGILSCSRDAIRKIEQARKMHMIIDGHAPGLRGKELCAYLVSGIRSDHESRCEEEACEKLRLGMWLMIRESSTSKDLRNLVKPLVSGAIDSRHCMFVSDDRAVNDLLVEGHMDHILRTAISEGMDVITAIQLATINPATYAGLDGEIGSISPGCIADIILLSDLKRIKIESVIVGGRELSENLLQGTFKYPKKLTKTIKLKRRLALSDFIFKLRNGDREVYVTAIKLRGGSLLTSKEVTPVKVEDGIVSASREILYATVIERHRRTGNVGKGFVTGLGPFDGAIAQSIAHDSHNLIVVGSNPQDMLVAAKEVSAMQGGIALSSKGRKVASLRLCIAGLMSPESPEEVATQKEFLEKEAWKLGLKVQAPIISLSFLSLPVIPAIRLTDKGLYDVCQGAFIESVAKQKSRKVD